MSAEETTFEEPVLSRRFLARNRPSLKRTSFIGEVIRTLLFVVAVTALFDMTIPRSLVDGSSMQPTFFDGERLVVSRIHNLFSAPGRGDVIVFNSMRSTEPNTMLIKRVIGLPGEQISFREGMVYVEGVLLDEPYIREACRLSSCNDREIELGPDEFYVLGDNRNVSQDSRRFGAVTRDHIVGTVIFRYWPLDRFGLIQSHQYNGE